jgi:hypothetical protein
MPQNTKSSTIGAIAQIPYIGPAVVTGAVVYSVARSLWSMVSKAPSPQPPATRAPAPTSPERSRTGPASPTPARPPQPRASELNEAASRSPDATTANVATSASAVSPDLVSILAAMRSGAYVCLDSNVWMTPACRPAIEAFMAALAREDIRLRVSGEQLDELDRLQTKGDQATRSLATRAKHAITSFAAAGTLLLSNTVDRAAHHDFDSYPVKQTRGHLRAHRGLGRVIVVTDDVRLTGRVHSVRSELHRDADHVRVLDSRAFMRMLAEAPNHGR